MNKKRLLLSFLTVVLIIAVSSAIMETVLRLMHGIHIWKINSEKKGDLCTKKSLHPELIWETRSYACSFNAKGYKDFDHALIKPKDTFRIVIIGDSIASGQSIGMESMFGIIAQHKFNKELLSNLKFEVIMLARSGYFFQQELFLLNNEAINYSPNLIVWSYVLNDLAHPVYHDVSGGLADYYYQPKIYLIDFIKRKLFFLKAAWLASRCSAELFSRLHCLYWDKLEQNLTTLAQFSNKNSIPIVFMIHPVYEKGDFTNYSYDSLNQKIACSAQKAGLHVLNLLDRYKKFNADELFINDGNEFDRLHPNEKGNAIIASALFDYLVKNKFFSHAKYALDFTTRARPNDKGIKNSPEDLNRFVGFYKFSSGEPVLVFRKGKLLKASINNKKIRRLVRLSEFTFLMPKVNIVFIFHVNPWNETPLITIIRKNIRILARKVPPA